MPTVMSPLVDPPGAERPDDQQAELRQQRDHRAEERPDRVDAVVGLRGRGRWLGRNRSTSRCSWANALTTRMPGIVSASTLVISAQARPPGWKPCRSRLADAGGPARR